jgi:hypothetical protein
MAVLKRLFTCKPAEDESVDAEYVLNSNPDISIQVCPYAGGYAVGKWVESEGAMYDLGTFTSLARAMEIAVTA